MSIRERRLYDPDARKRRKSSLVSALSGWHEPSPSKPTSISELACFKLKEQYGGECEMKCIEFKPTHGGYIRREIERVYVVRTSP